MEALICTFTLYREDLSQVKIFKYLGRLIVFNNIDIQAGYGNLDFFSKNMSSDFQSPA